jgi:hypothetical protein
MTETLLEASPDGAFLTNLQAYHALRVLATPDGEHNRAQRRELSKELRRRLGKSVIADFDKMYAAKR